jgi:hypothetical protein
MTAPTDDEDDLTGKAGGASFSATEIPNETEEEAAERRRKKKGDSGEGDSDSFGRGKAGAGAGGGIKISAQKLKQVMADWRQLDINELMDAVVEFFSEVPLRASANVLVNWVKTATSSVKSFAIVNWAMDAGRNAVRDWDRTRERRADALGGRTGGAGDSRGNKATQPIKSTHSRGQNPNFVPKH